MNQSAVCCGIGKYYSLTYFHVKLILSETLCDINHVCVLLIENKFLCYYCIIYFYNKKSKIPSKSFVEQTTNKEIEIISGKSRPNSLLNF